MYVCVCLSVVLPYLSACQHLCANMHELVLTAHRPVAGLDCRTQDIAQFRREPKPVDAASISAHQYEVDVIAEAAKGQGEADTPSLPDEPIVWVVAGLHREKTIDSSKNASMKGRNRVCNTFIHMHASAMVVGWVVCMCVGRGCDARGGRCGTMWSR
jgi:hypothetical protein